MSRLLRVALTVVAPVAVGLSLLAVIVYGIREVASLDLPEPTEADAGPKPAPPTADDVRNFRRGAPPSTYWLGRTFGGMRITRLRAGAGERSVAYGEPTLLVDSGASWVYPIELSTQPRRKADDAERRASDRWTVRGVPVLACPPECEDMEVLTGRHAVYVEGSRLTSRRAIERIVRALRPIRREAPASGPLPQPRPPLPR